MCRGSGRIGHADLAYSTGKVKAAEDVKTALRHGLVAGPGWVGYRTGSVGIRKQRGYAILR